jgi:predicted MFS family arabinose efflux permease
VKFFPFELLTDRTVLGAYILSALLFVSWYIWNSYFSSYLQVVTGLSITEASYVGNIYGIGSCFWSLLVGLAIRYTGRYKWVALFFGMPLSVLGHGLIIKYRQPGEDVGVCGDLPDLHRLRRRHARDL